MQAYREHRRRVSALARSLQRGQGLCVLGAGNCDDVELLELVEAFGNVHLVDLLPRAGKTAEAMVSAIAAGPFDVVLSACALTQLWLPLKRTLVLSSSEGQRLFALLSLTHLLTMARLVRPGGSAALVTEVAVGAAAEPNLGVLLMLLREHPELSLLVRDLRLIEPWSWTLDGAKASVHAVVFSRAS